MGLLNRETRKQKAYRRQLVEHGRTRVNRMSATGGSAANGSASRPQPPQSRSSKNMPPRGTFNIKPPAHRGTFNISKYPPAHRGSRDDILKYIRSYSGKNMFGSNIWPNTAKQNAAETYARLGYTLNTAKKYVQNEKRKLSPAIRGQSTYNLAGNAATYFAQLLRLKNLSRR